MPLTHCSELEYSSNSPQPEEHAPHGEIASAGSHPAH